VNRQIGVADSKYVVLDDPLPPGHVTWRMRIANFAIKIYCNEIYNYNEYTLNYNEYTIELQFTLLSSITQQRIKIEA